MIKNARGSFESRAAHVHPFSFLRSMILTCRCASQVAARRTVPTSECNLFLSWDGLCGIRLSPRLTGYPWTFPPKSTAARSHLSPDVHPPSLTPTCLPRHGYRSRWQPHFHYALIRHRHVVIASAACVAYHQFGYIIHKSVVFQWCFSTGGVGPQSRPPVGPGYMMGIHIVIIGLLQSWRLS